MSSRSSYTVYTASAGSGKTFALVREYLSLLLSHDDPHYFRRILAITFTNKAAYEMKNRIIEGLKSFEKKEASALLDEVIRKTELNSDEISRRAHRILTVMFRYYDDVYITTIDAFTHKIIRTFAREFRLRSDFEVSMDTELFLHEAIETVMQSIGEDESLTRLLLDFTFGLIDEDKSWRIETTLFDFSKKLVSESHKKELDKYLDRDISEFTLLKNQLDKRYYELSHEMKKIAAEALELIQKETDRSWFSNGTLPNFFIKIEREADIGYELDKKSVEKKIQQGNLVKKKEQTLLPPDSPVMHKLIASYDEIMKLGKQKMLCSILRNSIPPTAALSYIYRKMLDLLSERNMMLISEFNEMIYHHIKNHPVPYIYERLGINLRNYFLDEMQDTSLMQWDNMEYLVEEALSSGGSLMLVGDAKQSIYRWRGGEPEQFMDLADSDIPSGFVSEKKVVSLKDNYRSLPVLVHFNNDFFQYAAHILSNPHYKKLYGESLLQNPVKKKGGYIQMDFIDASVVKPGKLEAYTEKVLEVLTGLTQEYKPGDICILVRKNKDADALASFLTGKGIDVVSQESLKLSSQKRVNFVIQLLYSLLKPTEKYYRLPVLYFLYEHLGVSGELHEFIQWGIQLEEHAFFSDLQSYGVRFNVSEFREAPLYEAVESLIDAFHLINSSDAYLMELLEIVFSYQQKYGSDLAGFVEYWELREDKFSIARKEEDDAVNIMTVHKSKGLEFPVVIYAYDTDFNKMKDFAWLHMKQPEKYHDFESFLVKINNKFNEISEETASLYASTHEKVIFDNLNILYVAFTRAKERLYIISEYVSKKKKIERFSDLLSGYLKEKGLWNDDSLSYSFGELISPELPHGSPPESKMLRWTSSRTYKNLYELPQPVVLWKSDSEKPVKEGLLLHKILSFITYAKDLEWALHQITDEEIFLSGLTPEKVRKIIGAVLSDKDLIPYYTGHIKVFNERGIMDENNQVYIPDRMVELSGGDWVIIDYKTGSPDPAHRKQLEQYAGILRRMGKKVKESLLVYLNEGGINLVKTN